MGGEAMIGRVKRTPVKLDSFAELRRRLDRGWVRRLLCTLLGTHVRPRPPRVQLVGSVTMDGHRPRGLAVCMRCGKAWLGPAGSGVRS